MQKRRPVEIGIEDYADFLPPGRRLPLVSPDSTWWFWKNHRVHLSRFRNPDAAVRLLVVHGAGAHGAALWPVAALLAGGRVDITAVDLPLYGRTVTGSRHTVVYEDWIALLVDLLTAEDDGRPVVLFGASIGGFLAVQAAAASHGVAAVIATCLLDPRDRGTQAALTRFGSFATPFMPLLSLVRGPVARIPVKISWIADLARMGRDPALGRLCARDPRGGGAWLPLGFLASYLRHPHTQARTVPLEVHLMHPELDQWTPKALSERTLRTLPGPTGSRALRGCGHFPLEEPGLQDLLDGLEEVLTDAASGQDATPG